MPAPHCLPSPVQMRICFLAMHDPILHAITDDTRRSPQNLAEIISRAARGGITAVQFREKSRRGGSLQSAYLAVAVACRAAGISLILNGDLAGPIEPTRGSFLPDAIQASNRTLDRLQGQRPFGYSAHSVEEAVRAAALGAEYVTLSPIWHTPLKSGVLEPLGVEALIEARRQLPTTCKLIALGGVDAKNARLAIKAGADGIAVMRAIFNAPDPEVAARALRYAVQV